MNDAYIAIDLGAESGRVMVGVLADGRLRLEEAHRFMHEPVWLPTGLHWDTTGIWREVMAGLRRAGEWARDNDVRLQSIGVDTWGVDWALVDSAGELCGLPHAYRDPRNAAAYEEVVAKLGAERIYQTTGIQFMPLNSLYSLYAHQSKSRGRGRSESLAAAERLLFMPDLLNYWLCGKQAVEATIASTSQMIDCHTGDWAHDMLDELGLSTRLLGPITPPGTVLGTLDSNLAEATGLPAELRVVTTASHDTASAIAAVPARGDEPWCYLSSGTWSLLGAELAEPCVSSTAQDASFTNELGVGGTFRFLKNIAGLWLVQECRRDLARQGQEFDYAKLTQLADQAEPFRTLVDPAHPSFQSPGDMLRKIDEYAQTSGQPAPESPGQFVRCCLESLALAYREKLETLESILSKRYEVIHIVGGGGKNKLLCQMTADSTRRRVVVGPYEATATGNLLVQAIGLNHIADLAELRSVVARSFDVRTHQPRADAGWDAAAERFRALALRPG